MGNFYTNVTIIGREARAAADRLRELGRRAIVADAGASCVVFDSDCENQDTNVLSALAEDLSSSLNATALAVLNHDDDILWLQLYRRGDLVAEYANRGGPSTNVRDLCRTLGRPQRALQVWFTLRRPYVFQVSRHSRLVELLDLPSEAVATGFTYLEQGELPPGLSEDRLQRV
jgi:hypothetical protein